MATLLWIISFILHGISFLIMVLLYFRLEQTKDIERNQATILKDMEDLLSAYITEIKDENEAFLDKAKQDQEQVRHADIQIKNDVSVKSTNIQPRINTVEDQLTDHDLASLLPSYDDLVDEKIVTRKKESITLDSMPDIKNNIEPLSIGQQARLLHNSGLSVEEIAKKFNKGKTEIELFLKFNV